VSRADINWGARTLFITKSFGQTAAGLRVKTTKNKKPRRFMLPQSAIAALQFQRDQQAEHKRQLRQGLPESRIGLRGARRQLSSARSRITGDRAAHEESWYRRQHAFAAAQSRLASALVRCTATGRISAARSCGREHHR
jgi:integrase